MKRVATRSLPARIAAGRLGWLQGVERQVAPPREQRAQVGIRVGTVGDDQIGRARTPGLEVTLLESPPEVGGPLRGGQRRDDDRDLFATGTADSSGLAPLERRPTDPMLEQ
jgi:hypothetical protein